MVVFWDLVGGGILIFLACAGYALIRWSKPREVTKAEVSIPPPERYIRHGQQHAISRNDEPGGVPLPSPAELDMETRQFNDKLERLLGDDDGTSRTYP